MEGWRDWSITQKIMGTKEKADQREPKKIEDEDFPPALFVYVLDGEYELILYKPTVRYNTDPIEYDNPKVIGMIVLTKTNLECIPDTMQVNYSAVDEEYQNQGYGSLLYGLAFHYANNIMGSGLTSDHDHSTSPQAQALWNKYANTKDMVKKKTKGKPPAGGHDTFDYSHKKTPKDKNDDCDAGAGDSPKDLGTHHSWIMKNNKFKNVFKQLNEQHKAYLSTSGVKRDFTLSLVMKAQKVFNKEYGE